MAFQSRKGLFTAAMLSLALVLVCTDAKAAETWRWIRIEPSYSPPSDIGWSVLEGVTAIDFDSDTFTAVLKHEDERSLREYVLKGEINGTSVVVTETQLYTEPAPRTYKGNVKKIRYPGDPWGIDRIVVTDGSTHIEIMRSVRVTDGDASSP